MASSKLYVSLPIQGSPLLSNSSSTGSIPIRAPITPDDESSDVESSGYKTDSSDSHATLSSIENGSEFDTGEDFETASERPLSGDPVDETVERSNDIDKNPIFRPFVANPNEENSLKSGGEEEENGGVTVELVSLDVKRVMPVAQLSLDDDEFDGLVSEEGVVSEEEDGRFSAIAKVPSCGVLQRVDSAPRVKASWGDDDNEFFEAEDSILCSEDDDVANYSVPIALDEDKGHIVSISKENVELQEDIRRVVDDSVSVSAILVKNEELISKAGDGEPLAERKKGDLEEDSGLEEYVKQLAEERLLLENLNLEEVDRMAGACDVANHASEQPGAIQNKPQELSDGIDETPKLQELNFDGASGFLNGSDVSEKLTETEKLAGKTGQEPDIGYGSIVQEDAITFESMNNNIKMEAVSFSTDCDLPKDSTGDILENRWQNGCSVTDIKDAANCNSGRIEARSFSVSDEDIEDLIWEHHEKANHIANELEQMSVSSYLSDVEGSPDRQIVVESYNNANTDDEEGKKFSDFSFKTAIDAELDERNVTVTSANGSTSRVFSLERPVGSGSSFRSVRPASSLDVTEDFAKQELSEEEKKKVEKIQYLMLTFLSLAQKLGHSPEDSIVAQVLQRLVFVTGRRVNLEAIRASFKNMTLPQDAKTKCELEFSLNILVVGRTGVGKSATVNSIFANKGATVSAFEPATTKVKEIIGTIDGVRIRIFDTPGLRSSAKEETTNRKILASIKKLTKKFPPDVVLYVDRLDAHARDFSDLPLLKLLTDCLTTSIWRNAIVTLTHAASAPPDGPSGSPLNFEVFVAQRSHAVQQAISQAVGDIRLMHPSMMHPVTLVENHPMYQKNENRQSLLPNGQHWRSQLLLLCYSLKIQSEASLVYKTRDTSNHMKLFGFHFRALPLSHLVSSLLQTRPHRKLGPDQGGDDIDSDVELMDLSNDEDGNDYDELPPFRPLRKSQVDRLTKERKAYYEEYDYRVKLFQQKQLREEVKRLKEMKKKGKDGKNKDGDFKEDLDHEDGGPATVPVPLPDFVLPPSFDSDHPSYRFRVLEPTSELIVRPVLDWQGWDHDCGYDGVSIESNVAINSRFPGGFVVQMTKDKKEFKIHLDSSVFAKPGENASTMAGFDIQTVGRQLAYIIRSETKFQNFKINKTAGGISITIQGKDVATGLKIEDQIAVGKRFAFTGSVGAVTSSGDTAFGANFEMRIKGEDFPVEQDQSTLGLSLMKWRRELGLMANFQSLFSVGRSSKMAISVGMNSKRNGQISIKTNSSELQIALLGILPVVMSIIRGFYPSSSAPRNSNMFDY